MTAQAKTRSRFNVINLASGRQRMIFTLVARNRIRSAVFWFLLSYLLRFGTASDPGGGRHSFSLTTFDPKGRLFQVEYAIQAASSGIPIIAVVHPDERRVFLLALQILPSVLMADDGTPRFSRITSEIVIAHSGVSADGRVLLAAAHRAAVEHQYTFDEEIPIHLFLHSMSLLFQEYTMKPGVRPFGALVLVAYMPREDLTRPSSTAPSRPRLYKLDPSGSVESLGKVAIVNGNLDRTNLSTELGSIRDQMRGLGDVDALGEIAKLLSEALVSMTGQKDDQDFSNVKILSATVSAERFTIRHHES